ncbi:hypothetical protein BRADI_2g10071v3 [Brachypodium distachyon]|uniref:Uncharacterized protein n=1 Tax=Brachypodium distachyon TaxID=15368 RepID=A0A0Q3MHA5_BRADI|nr:hypothetical protein BRADI_2g10071v3 [Brachypodium distachyon]
MNGGGGDIGHGLGVLGAHDAVEVCAHVGELSVGLVGHVVREHAGAHGRGVQHPHDPLVRLRGLPARRAPDALAVHLRRPRRLLQQLPPRRLLAAPGVLLLLLLPVALERDAHHAGGADVLDELGRGHAHVQQQHGGAPGAVVEGDGDAGPAVAVERPRGARGAVELEVAPDDAAGEVRQRGEAAAGRRREEREGAERGAHGAHEPGRARPLECECCFCGGGGGGGYRPKMGTLSAVAESERWLGMDVAPRKLAGSRGGGRRAGGGDVAGSVAAMGAGMWESGGGKETCGWGRDALNSTRAGVGLWRQRLVLLENRKGAACKTEELQRHGPGSARPRSAPSSSWPRYGDAG